MADPTTPAAAVESLDTNALEETLGDIFGDEESEQKPEAGQEASADQPDGVSEDDLPDDPDAAPDDGAAFEIVHNGQQHKLSREETIRLAQQGFDYTQKTQAVAAQARAAEQVLQRAAQVEQMMPHLTQELAQVKAIEAQLAQYSKVDWIALATNDPLEYPKYRAQYDQLVGVYQTASQQYQHKANAVLQERQNLTAYHLQQEAQALTARIPEWRDPAKYQAGAQKLRSYLIAQGADQADVDTLSSSVAVVVARKAMLYDELVSAKSAKSKQLRNAPPVVRPGAVAPSDKGKTNFVKARQEFKRAGQQGKSRAQETILEGLLSRTFK